MTAPYKPGSAAPRKPFNAPRRPPGGADMARVRQLLAKPTPTWSVCHGIGVELNREIEPECSLRELAAELGITPQMAYHESNVALGKLAWHFWRRVGRPGEAS